MPLGLSVTFVVLISSRVGMGWIHDAYLSMIDGDVVIGRWDQPSSQAVNEYSMSAKAVSDITRYSTQELSTSTLQTVSGITTLAFTRPLSPVDHGKISINSHGAFTTTLWAYGS